MKNKKISDDKIKQIYILHSLGETNRCIAKKLGLHHNTIRDYLNKRGLISNGRKNQPINKINDTQAICSKCNEIKNINEFQIGRKDKTYEYHFSYCNKCRKQQVYLNLNSSIEKFLNDKYNRLKTRAIKNNTPFDLKKEDFINIFLNQNGICFYTDEKMEIRVGKGYSRNSLSVDKIIPEKGYILNNVVFCTVKSNTTKNDLTLDEIKKYLPTFYFKIIKHLNILDKNFLEKNEIIRKAFEDARKKTEHSDYVYEDFDDWMKNRK